MRFLCTTLFLFALLAAKAQPLHLTDLLALTSCRDTVCMAAFADSAGFCKKMGNLEDGWVWFSCEQVVNDSLVDAEHSRSLGYSQHGRDQRNYIIGTRDTAYATTLTHELDRLGFKADKPLHEGDVYRSTVYAGVAIHRLEKRMTNIDRNGTHKKQVMWVFNVVVRAE